MKPGLRLIGLITLSVGLVAGATVPLPPNHVTQASTSATALPHSTTSHNASAELVSFVNALGHKTKTASDSLTVASSIDLSEPWTTNPKLMEESWPHWIADRTKTLTTTPTSTESQQPSITASFKPLNQFAPPCSNDETSTLPTASTSGHSLVREMAQETSTTGTHRPSTSSHVDIPQILASILHISFPHPRHSKSTTLNRSTSVPTATTPGHLSTRDTVTMASATGIRKSSSSWVHPSPSWRLRQFKSTALSVPTSVPTTTTPGRLSTRKMVPMTSNTKSATSLTESSVGSTLPIRSINPIVRPNSIVDHSSTVRASPFTTPRPLTPPNEVDRPSYVRREEMDVDESMEIESSDSDSNMKKMPFYPDTMDKHCPTILDSSVLIAPDIIFKISEEYYKKHPFSFVDDFYHLKKKWHSLVEFSIPKHWNKRNAICTLWVRTPKTFGVDQPFRIHHTGSIGVNVFEAGQRINTTTDFWHKQPIAKWTLGAHPIDPVGNQIIIASFRCPGAEDGKFSLRLNAEDHLEFTLPQTSNFTKVEEMSGMFISACGGKKD